MRVSQKGVYLGLLRKNRDVLDSELWWILHSKEICQGWKISLQWLSHFWVGELPIPLMSPAHSGSGVPASLGPKHELLNPCMEGRTSQWEAVTAWQVQLRSGVINVWGNKYYVSHWDDGFFHLQINTGSISIGCVLLKQELWELMQK